MISAVRGVTLRVASVTKVRDFYVETLALDLTAEQDDMVSFEVGGAMVCLDARAGGDGSPSRQPASGFTLWFICDEFQPLMERLNAARASFVRGPEKSTGNGKWFAVVKDPAGNEVRIDEK